MNSPSNTPNIFLRKKIYAEDLLEIKDFCFIFSFSQKKYSTTIWESIKIVKNLLKRRKNRGVKILKLLKLMILYNFKNMVILVYSKKISEAKIWFFKADSPFLRKNNFYIISMP